MLALLKTLLLPPAGPMLLAFWGLLMVHRGRRWGRWWIGVGLALAWLLSTEAVVGPLARWYASSPAPHELHQRASAWRGRHDAVVLVLGAGVREGTHPEGGYDLKPLTAERLRRGQWWASHLQIDLAFTGGLPANAEPGRPSEAAVVAKALAEQGAPAPAWLDHRATDTRGNARFSAEHLRQHGTRHVLLVTHALHMPRALRHFRRAAPSVELLPAPVSYPAGKDWRLTDWLPSAEGAARGAYLVYEATALVMGH